MWLNFMTINAMYIYWPVILVGLTVIILFLPLRILYHRSRQWWAYSNVRTPFRVGITADRNSGAYCSRASILSSSAISSWETCIAPKHTLWA